MKHFIIYTVQVHVLRSFVHLCMCERLFQGLFTEDLYLQMDRKQGRPENVPNEHVNLLQRQTS